MLRSANDAVRSGNCTRLRLAAAATLAALLLLVLTRSTIPATSFLSPQLSPQHMSMQDSRCECTPPTATFASAPLNCSPPAVTPRFPHRHMGDIYDAMLQRVLAQPASERKYIVLHPTGGWGNKLRAIVGMLHVALLTQRVMLLDARVGWIREYFTPPVKPLFTDEVQDLKEYERRDLSMKCLGEGRVFEPACTGNQQPRVAFLEAHFTLQHTLWKHADSMYTLGRMGVPLGRYDAGVQTLEWLLHAPTQRLLRVVHEVKTAIQWNTCDLRIGMHFRSCIDCGGDLKRVPGDAMAVTTFACARAAVIDWAARRLSHFAAEARPQHTCLYFAVDDVKAGWRQEAINALGDVARVVWHPNVTVFRNSGGTHALPELDIIMSEWYMLGEADYVFGTDTTFHQFAAMRTNVESRSAHMLRDGSGTWVCDPMVYVRPQEPIYPDTHY